MNKATGEALAASGISVSLGGQSIIRRCSLQVETGEFIGIIGPNGAGKSTLLKALRGIVPLEEGSVSLCRHPLTKLRDKQAARLVAYMQQEVSGSFGFTALEIVLAGRYPYLKWWQNESREDLAIARKYMAFTGVEALADKPVTCVSGGERQRILLAKALAQETPVIFLDEPTASLDLLYQEEIFRCCRELCQGGKSILMVAHDIRLAAKFCSRLILLANGKIVADGTPEQVVTSENLAKGYGLQSAVFLNRVTGHLDIHTYAAVEALPKPPVIHLIGGGGAICQLLRLLYERQYRVSVGVVQEGDTDAETAGAFDIDMISGPAFCEITPEQARQHREKIQAADIVVLGNLCYGRQNIDNLQAAFLARRLIVIEDTPLAERDFTQGQAAALYQELTDRPQARVMTSQEFLHTVEHRGLTEGNLSGCQC